MPRGYSVEVAVGEVFGQAKPVGKAGVSNKFTAQNLRKPYATRL